MPAFSRYKKDSFRPDFKGMQSSETINLIRAAIETGEVQIEKAMLLTQADRLDHLAGAIYGDARYWWIIATASEIGWALQAPPGTVIKIPSLKDIERLFG
jgi:hypothetical protein